MSVKNNWSKKIFVFLLACMSVASSFPIPPAKAVGLGEMIFLWDGASIPSGWTCVSCTAGDPFYNVFPRAASSYGGTGGGPETGITHTVSYNTSTGNSGSAVSIITVNVVDPAVVSASGHTHTGPASITSSSASILPEYRNLKFIMKTDPISLPVGIIGMFDKTSLPVNWTAYDAMNNDSGVQRFLRGSDTFATGGAATHNHTRAISGNSGAASATSPANTTTPTATTVLSSHTHTVAAGTAPDANNLPPYATVVFAKLTVDNDSPPDGLIAMFNTTSMLIGWTVISGAGSSYENRLIRGTSTCGSPCPQTGGATTHTHTSQVVTSSVSSSLDVTLLTTTVAPGAHTHSFTVNYNSQNSMPLYRDVILAKLKAIDISGTVYSGEGTGPLSGKNIKVGILRDAAYGAARVAVTNGSGVYSVKVPDPGAGNNISVWLNGETEKGAVSTRSGGGDITGLDIYQNRLIVRHEDAGPITNANIGVCDKNVGVVCSTSDLFFDEASGVLSADSGVQIFVWSGKTFTPGGNVSSPEIKLAGTLSAGSNTITLTGNGTPFVISGGTFTPSTSTVTYAPAGTTGVTVASTTYNNVIFNKASNTFSLASGGITTQIGGDLTITAGTLDTVSGQNYPISVGGSWSNSGTFTANSGTVTFTSTATGKTLAGTLNGASGFYNLIFNGSGGWSNSSAMLVNNDLTMTAGTLSGTISVDVKGSVTGTAGVINKTGGTFTQQATGGNKSFGATTAGTNWTFSSLTFANDGSPRTITTNSGTGTMTVSSVLTITSSTVVDAGNRTWILSGSGTPAVISGTITPSTSTFRFTGSSATSIRAADYYNLQIFPGGASATHTLGTSSGQTFTVANNLDLGGNSNSTGTVITAATNNPAISVAGNLTLCAATCSNQMTFTKGTGTLTLKPSGTKTWTDNNTTMQDVGVVSISGGSASPQINLGSHVLAESVNVGFSHTLNMNGSNLTLTGNGTPFVISGTFTPSTSTVTYAPAGTTGVTVASTTYNNVIFNKASNTFSLASGGITTQIGGDLTITAGTLDTVSGQNYPISVGGNWTNNGTFTANSGTVTFTSTNLVKTLAGTMTGSSAFYNLTFNGSGGSWTLSNDATVSSVLNIAVGTLNASSQIVTLSGSGTPLVIAGTLIPSTSTFRYTGTSATNITATVTAYYNLEDIPASGSPTHTLGTAGSQTIYVFNNLLIGNGTNAVTTTANTNNPIIAVTGNVTIAASAIFWAPPSASFTVGGNWSNSGTLTHNSGAISFIAASTGKTITSGGSSFNNLTFNNASGGWTLQDTTTLAGDLTMKAGTLAGAVNVTILGGDLICLTTCGTITFTGGIATLRGTGDFGTSGLSPTWTFAGLAFGDGSTTATTSTQGSGTITTSTLTVNTSHTFSAGSKTYVINGSGTPVVVTGTLTPGTSTFQYKSTSATNLAATTYYNLEDIPAGTVTHTLAAGTLSVGNNFLIGNGTNAVTATANTNDPIIAVTGNVTIAASAIFWAPPSASFTVGGNWSNSSTFTANSGTVNFNNTGTKTITRGTSDFYGLTFSGAGTWSFTGTGSTSLSLRNFNITHAGATVTGVSGTTTMVGNWGNIGTYTHNNGTVLFTTAAVTSNVTGATTFKNLTVTEETKTLRFEAGKRTKIAGVITVGGASPTYVCAFPVNLFSITDGSRWEIEILGGGSTSIQYAYVKDSDAITTAITANNTFKSGVSNWLGTGCLPKMTSILPSPLEGIVGSVVSFIGSDLDANGTAVVQWGAKDSATLNDTTATIKTDGRGKFQADVAGYDKLNFFIPEDEAGIHKIAIKVSGTSPVPRTIDPVSTSIDFTLKPWFWMSDFSAHVGNVVTLIGNGYICGGLATVVRGGTVGQSTGGTDVTVGPNLTTNITIQPVEDCTGSGGGGGTFTITSWEEIGDF